MLYLHVLRTDTAFGDMNARSPGSGYFFGIQQKPLKNQKKAIRYTIYNIPRFADLWNLIRPCPLSQWVRPCVFAIRNHVSRSYICTFFYGDRWVAGNDTEKIAGLVWLVGWFCRPYFVYYCTYGTLFFMKWACLLFFSFVLRSIRWFSFPHISYNNVWKLWKDRKILKFLATMYNYAILSTILVQNRIASIFILWYSTLNGPPLHCSP